MNSKVASEIKKTIETIMVTHDEDSVKESAENYFESLNSISFIELIVSIENKYDIEINDEELVLQKDRNLDSFILMIESYINNS